VGPSPGILGSGTRLAFAAARLAYSRKHFALPRSSREAYMQNRCAVPLTVWNDLPKGEQMDAAEVRSITAATSAAGIDVTDWLETDARGLAKWESGRAPVPAIAARQLRWLAVLAENERRRSDAGMGPCPECVAREEAFIAAIESNPDGAPSGTDSELDWDPTYIETCPECREFNDWADQNLEPLSPFPQPGLAGLSQGLMSWIDGLPEWLQPVFLGPALLLGMILAKGAIVLVPAAILVFVFNGPSGFEGLDQAAAWIGLIVLSSAVSGLAYGLIGRHIRASAPGGDYLAGIVSVAPYMAAVAAVVQAENEGLSVFAPWSVPTFFVFAVCTVVFGAVLGHALFADEDR